jgi:hypothetical protein
LNCGSGTSFTDAPGRVWLADFGSTGGFNASAIGAPIARTTPDIYPLYDTRRYSFTNQSFDYNFALPNGQYAVTLKFADFDHSGPGTYKFDVLINGTMVMKGLDPDVVYGTSKTAVDWTFVTVVSAKF